MCRKINKAFRPGEMFFLPPRILPFSAPLQKYSDEKDVSETWP
jgi:hypothetical protein